VFGNIFSNISFTRHHRSLHNVAMKNLPKLVINTLNEHKAIDVVHLKVKNLTNVTDHLIICSGSSKTHVQALAEHVIMAAKANGIKPLGREGEKFGEWVLVDLGDVVVHIMLPAIREFY